MGLIGFEMHQDCLHVSENPYLVLSTEDRFKSCYSGNSIMNASLTSTVSAELARPPMIGCIGLTDVQSLICLFKATHGFLQVMLYVAR